MSLEDDAQRVRDAVLPREQGKAMGELRLEGWMVFGETVIHSHLENEQDRKAFLCGWQAAWQDRDLLIELLSDDEQVILECTRLSDKRKLVVERQLFRRARLCIGGPPPSHPETYDTSYDYHSPDAAINALTTWLHSETPEPDGWTRHRDTGRYRINRDKALEWVKDEDHWTLIQNIVRAVQATQGEDRVIAQVIPDNTLNLGGEFLEGAQCFFVTSESSNDANGVSVSWVFHYQDRSVVLGEDDIYEAAKENVARRLMGA